MRGAQLFNESGRAHAALARARSSQQKEKAFRSKIHGYEDLAAMIHRKRRKGRVLHRGLLSLCRAVCARRDVNGFPRQLEAEAGRGALGGRGHGRSVGILNNDPAIVSEDEWRGVAVRIEHSIRGEMVVHEYAPSRGV
jgi:hypothetical protein